MCYLTSCIKHYKYKLEIVLLLANKANCYSVTNVMKGDLKSDIKNLLWTKIISQSNIGALIQCIVFKVHLAMCSAPVLYELCRLHANSMQDKMKIFEFKSNLESKYSSRIILLSLFSFTCTLNRPTFIQSFCFCLVL